MTLGQEVTMWDNRKIRAIDALAKAVELDPKNATLCLELALVIPLGETVTIDSTGDRKDKIELFHRVADLDPRLLLDCCGFLAKAARDAALALVDNTNRKRPAYIFGGEKQQRRAEELLLRAIDAHKTNAAPLMHLVGLPDVKYPISLLGGTVLSKLDLCLRAIDLEPWNHAAWVSLFRAAPEGVDDIKLLNGKVLSKSDALKHGSRLLHVNRIASGKTCDQMEYLNLIKSLPEHETVHFPDGKEYGKLQIALLALQNGIISEEIVTKIFELTPASELSVPVLDGSSAPKKEIVCKLIEKGFDSYRVFDLLARSVASIHDTVTLSGRTIPVSEALKEFVGDVVEEDLRPGGIPLRAARLVASQISGGNGVGVKDANLSRKDIIMKFVTQGINLGENLNNLACSLPSDADSVEIDGRRFSKVDLLEASIMEQCSMACINLALYLERKNTLSTARRRQLYLQAFEFDPTNPLALMRLSHLLLNDVSKTITVPRLKGFAKKSLEDRARESHAAYIGQYHGLDTRVEIYDPIGVSVIANSQISDIPL
jgi:hypothetical protein